MTEFTPVTSLLGGALLGLSAVLLMATTGRIAGISGIVSRLLPPDTLRRSNIGGALFLVGMVCAVPVYQYVTGTVPEVSINASTPLLIASGLLVGIGSVIGSGCTSGHGICGLSRLSMRSVLATGSFMVAGFITVYLSRHIVGQ